jgi:hypothetical protein
MELKDYLSEKYATDNARHQKFEYHVARERFEITIYCNNKSAKIHADNLGLTLC